MSEHEHTSCTSFQESFFNQEQSQPTSAPDPISFINETINDPYCLNPHELLHPNDPNRNNKFYFSFLDDNEQRMLDSNKNINQQSYQDSSHQSYLDVGSLTDRVRKTNSDENMFSFNLSKDN